MKEEYRTELKKILPLFEANDEESRLLGLNLFYESKWYKNIRNHSDYVDLEIQDVWGSECKDISYTFLSDFFEDEVDVKHPSVEDASSIEDLIRCLLNGQSYIVKVEIQSDFS